MALAILILWRLSARTVAPIAFNERGMVLRGGPCTEAIPMRKLDRRHLTADVLDIERTFATMYDGSTIVDERISMPENYRFDKPLNELLGEIFHLDRVKSVADNGKAAIYEGVTKEGGSLRILAIYKGRYDLELLYPLRDGFYETVRRCLIEGKKRSGPDIVTRVVEEKEKKMPLSEWDEKLFQLGILVNKDM